VKLTEKQERFCIEYVICLNATQSALQAGYSSKTAYRIGAENMQKPQIRERIDEMLAEIKSGRIADAVEVMEYLTAVMRREKSETVVVTLSEEQTRYAPDEKGTMRKQTIKREVPELVEVPAKLSDTNKAAELLGRRYAIFTDTLKVTDDRPTIIDDIPGGGGDG
jgi:phage terminase small subunit